MKITESERLGFVKCFHFNRQISYLAKNESVSSLEYEPPKEDLPLTVLVSLGIAFPLIVAGISLLIIHIRKKSESFPLPKLLPSRTFRNVDFESHISL